VFDLQLLLLIKGVCIRAGIFFSRETGVVTLLLLLLL
jgi:hypothetical protein